jgi:hypothetical protein
VPSAGTEVLSYPSDSPRSVSARVASRVPEFGGAYIDGQGYLTVYLTNLGRQEIAQRALINELLARGRESPNMRMRYGQYSFAELWRWKTALRPLLTTSGVALLTVDERTNRVRIATSGSTVALARLIPRFGVPREAVEIEPTARIVEAGSVESGVRPAVGGLRIAGFFEQTGVTYTVICSYGPNVRDFADTVHRYMVVASHCVQHAPAAGGYIGANVYQPDTTALRANLIGSVVANPAFVSGGTCPTNAFCRASDAALVRVAPGVATTIGAVAHPVGRAFLPQIYGPTAIDPSQPTFTLSGYTEALVGDTVDKVGSSTGWTAGAVTAVCADVVINGYIRTCSGVVSAGAGQGDSGAPVMFRNARKRYYVAGIVFGLNDDGPDGVSGHQYYFSTWQSISDDLAGFPGLGVR